MCKLSIITMNYNNAVGLEKTMQSVLSQTSIDFEYIVVDGASTDGSCGIIQKFAHHLSISSSHHLQWVSEPDNGIYHAMNKGIRMAKGEYLQFLNSGDTLVCENVVESMLEKLAGFNEVSILYGNMLKILPKGIYRDKGFAGRQPTMLDFFTGTLNHSPAYIKRSLFHDFGLYDESLKIVSDWKWYMEVIVFKNTQIQYVNIDVSEFDMNGISSTNQVLNSVERQNVLSQLLSEPIYNDYCKYAKSLKMINRLEENIYTRTIVTFLDRIILKYKKIFNKF